MRASFYMHILDKGKFLLLISFFAIFQLYSNPDTRRYTIETSKGDIILAYKSFAEFLDTNREWESFYARVLKPYPEVRKIHSRRLQWGDFDTEQFAEQLKLISKEETEGIIQKFDLSVIQATYGRVLRKASLSLPSLSKEKVNLCLFLSYNGCFYDEVDEQPTVFYSLKIGPENLELILSHELGHFLHRQRVVPEPETLAREIVSEGIAVYFSAVILEQFEIEKVVPFMPRSSVKWCLEHEDMLRSELHENLELAGMDIYKKYISDGSFAKPPEGFPAKTAYFAGYRIIESCINKGLSLDDICRMTSTQVIEASEYFL